MGRISGSQVVCTGDLLHKAASSTCLWTLCALLPGCDPGLLPGLLAGREAEEGAAPEWAWPSTTPPPPSELLHRGGAEAVTWHGPT